MSIFTFQNHLLDGLFAMPSTLWLYSTYLFQTYTTTLKDGTYYDYGEDGMKEKTAWSDRGDGFLVYDKNGDGTMQKILL